MTDRLRRETFDSGTHWEALAGYSRAVRIGDRILVSGTTATDAGGLVGGDDPAAQANFIIDKIEAAITHLGGQLRDVVMTRVYLNDMSHWEAVSRVHGARFGAIRPANVLVQVHLVGDEYMVEIEAEAVVGAGDTL